MSVQEQINNVGTSVGPAWTISGSQTLLAWKGEADTKILWSTTSALAPDSNSNQYTWAPQQVVPNVGTSASPALANFKGGVYLAWKGESDTSILWSKLGANGVWSPQAQVPGVGTSDSPALAASATTLYMAWKGEGADTGIYWSQLGANGAWSPQTAVPGVGGTSNGPALAVDLVGNVYLAWKAQPGDERIFWSMTTDGKTWSTQSAVPGAATSTGPGLAVDFTLNLNLAWRTDNGSIFFSTLVAPIANTLWSPPTVRSGVDTSDRPMLLGFPVAEPGPLMLAWKGEGSDPGVYYGPLNLPAQAYDFNLPAFQILNMRSGTIFGKTESDTDYVSLGLKIIGQQPQVITEFVGDQTGGNVPVTLNFSNVKVFDTDRVVLSYAIVNSSQGNATTAFLVNAGNTLLNAAEKADEVAIQELTGLDLSSLTPTEAGVLIGAQIGTATVPIIGTALGALAGWILGIAPWGSLWPDCDGPVAAGVHIFSGAALRAGLANNGTVGAADDNPGVNSQGGCGSNSHYVVNWNIKLHS
jgi:hypothetical protein